MKCCLLLIRLENAPPECCVEMLPLACHRSSTLEDDDDEEKGYPEGTYFVCEYTLKIDHVYKDELNSTYPDTPRTVEFSSSGLGTDGCRLDFDVGTGVAAALFEKKDGGGSSSQGSCS